jgi:hypothetical protein
MQVYQINAKKINLLFICIASILTVGMATRWSFNLFEPQFLWKAYNYYFLSIINGHLDIPVEAIGSEGGFFNSKAYMYYGLLPALLRGLLYPFIDLAQTPVSYFSVLFFTLVGHITLQLSLVDLYLRKQKTLNFQIELTALIGASLILWFGSASFLISQNATIYHEPYAASLCLVNIFIALLIRDDFFLKRKTAISLLPYSIITGLCIHARMPTALTLYLTTGFIILIQSYRLLSDKGIKPSIYSVVVQSLKSYWVCISILGMCGFSILWLNYAKYGDPMAFMGGNYGYRFFEGYSERTCNIYPQTQFSDYLRIIPNTVVYLTGSWDLHWSLSWHLATGYGRKELPLIPLLLLWPLPLLCFSFLIQRFFKNISNTKIKLLFIGLLTFSVGAFFQLKYPTIAHRYVSEFWTPVFLSTLYCCYLLLTKTSEKQMEIKITKMKYVILVILLFTGLVYQLYLANVTEYYVNDGPSHSENFHFNDKSNAFLKSLTPEKITKLRNEVKRKQNEGCEALRNKLNLPVIR